MRDITCSIAYVTKDWIFFYITCYITSKWLYNPVRNICCQGPDYVLRNMLCNTFYRYKQNVCIKFCYVGDNGTPTLPYEIEDRDGPAGAVADTCLAVPEPKARRRRARCAHRRRRDHVPGVQGAGWHVDVRWWQRQLCRKSRTGAGIGAYEG